MLFDNCLLLDVGLGFLDNSHLLVLFVDLLLLLDILGQDLVVGVNGLSSGFNSVEEIRELWMVLQDFALARGSIEVIKAGDSQGQK